MDAYWYDAAGTATEVLQFGQHPDPIPKPDEVRVRVTHSAVNPTDIKRRTAGREIKQFGRIIPNNDGAGIIDRVGAEVPTTRIGERVWIFGAQAGRPCGTAAKYVTLPSRQAIALPDRVSLRDGACLGVPAVTAHRGLFADGPVDGKTVLIAGAVGRVGSCAVQLAKWAGARVIGTAGSAEKVAAVRELGADLALNYATDDVVGAVRDFTDGTGVDRVVDPAFCDTIALAPRIIKPNGVIASYASNAEPNPKIPFAALMYQNILIRPFAIYAMPRAAQDQAFADITLALQAGALIPRIGATMAFADMVAAHALMERDGLWGCLVVHVADEA